MRQETRSHEETTYLQPGSARIVSKPKLPPESYQSPRVHGAEWSCGGSSGCRRSGAPSEGCQKRPEGTGAGDINPEDKSENCERVGADTNTSRTPERRPVHPRPRIGVRSPIGQGFVRPSSHSDDQPAPRVAMLRGRQASAGPAATRTLDATKPPKGAPSPCGTMREGINAKSAAHTSSIVVSAFAGHSSSGVSSGL
jgi:hypothetical protein